MFCGVCLTAKSLWCPFFISYLLTFKVFQESTPSFKTPDSPSHQQTTSNSNDARVLLLQSEITDLNSKLDNLRFAFFTL